MTKFIAIIITVIILIILTNYLIKFTKRNEGFSFFTIRRDRERRAKTTTTKPFSVLAAPNINRKKAFIIRK